MYTLSLLCLLFAGPSFAALIKTVFPHLLIPLLSSAPDTPFGTRYDATVSYSAKTGTQEITEISFDVPSNSAAICRLNFYINTSSAKNAPRNLSGTGPFAINISRLEPRINQDEDTWNNHPDIVEYYATYELTQLGSVKTVYSKWFDCPKGQLAQFVIRPASVREFKYYWFELDYPASEGGPHGVTLEMYT